MLETGDRRSREMFVDVFSMTDLCHQDHKGIIMNFINNSIISRSDFVKIVVALHFCCSRVRQVFSKSINFSLYSSQFLFGKLFQVFFNIGSELYCVYHVKGPAFSRTARPECPHPVL